MAMPEFRAVEERVRAVAARLFGTVETLGFVDGYPVLSLELPRPGRPRIFLDAGIHGEEPGSVAGLLLFLEEELPRFRDRFAFTVLPCLSPYGYERGERLDAKGRDPNRLFRHEDEPLVRAVRQALFSGPPPVACLDLHEDVDFEGFYMYELSREEPCLAPAILRAVAEVGPLAHGRDLDPPVEAGLVVRGEEAEDPEWFEKRELWPVAFLLAKTSPHVVTLESPGKKPLSLRAEMQRRALGAALELLVGEG